MNRRWTDEMDAELRRLYPTTTSPGLARHFGVTIGAVRERAARQDTPHLGANVVAAPQLSRYG